MVLSGVVGNGGFEAWLESNGQRASVTAAGLRLLGVPELAEVVDAVIGATRSVALADRDAETGSTADHSAQLEVLSEQVWKLDDRLTEAMTAAVETNPSEFRRST